MQDLALLLFLLVAFLATLALYVLPSVIAFRRAHPYRWPILILNLGAGWTGLLWIAAMAWAVWPERDLAGRT